MSRSRWSLVLVVVASVLFAAAAPAAPPKPTGKVVKPIPAPAPKPTGTPSASRAPAAPSVHPQDVHMAELPADKLEVLTAPRPLAAVRDGENDFAGDLPKMMRRSAKVPGTGEPRAPIKIQPGGGGGGPAPPAKKTPATDVHFDALSGDNDPQIAAGEHSLLVSGGTQLALYDKTGKLLAGKNGKSFTNPFSTSSLFQPLWNPSWNQNINTYLNLPSGMKCDAKKDWTVAANAAATQYCLSDYYDTRVTWDNYRKRYWVVALARNFGPGGAKAILPGRRSYLVIAVTKTTDPRDGFLEYFVGGAIEESLCNNTTASKCKGAQEYEPGDAGDYPIIAITPKLMVETQNISNVVSGKHRYAMATVFSADEAAAGCTKPCNWSYWNFHDPDGNIITAGLVPAATRGDDNGYSYLTMTWGDELLVYGFKSSATAQHVPDVVTRWVDLDRAFSQPIDPPLPGTSGKLLYTNIGNLALNAVVRDDKLYTVAMDCTRWDDSPDNGKCSDGVRVMSVSVKNYPPSGDRLSNAGSSGFIDHTFGLRGVGDATDAVVDYGMPNIAVNGNGDMVVVYMRASKSTYPEARYTVWYHDQNAISPSANLHKGSYAWASNIDTAGIAVDPEDSAKVWMVHGYGDNASDGVRFEVGSVKP